MASELFSAEDFENRTSQEIINYIGLNLGHLDRAVFNQLSLPLQTTILIINFDSEVSINLID